MLNTLLFVRIEFIIRLNVEQYLVPIGQRISMSDKLWGFTIGNRSVWRYRRGEDVADCLAGCGVLFCQFKMIKDGCTKRYHRKSKSSYTVFNHVDKATRKCLFYVDKTTYSIRYHRFAVSTGSNLWNYWLLHLPFLFCRPTLICPFIFCVFHYGPTTNRITA